MKKFILFVFSLIIGLAVFCGLNVKADSTITMTPGASVRTTGDYQGLRFLASVDTLEGSTEHGFFLAIGEHSLSDMQTAIEGGASTVGGYKLVKKVAAGSENSFAVTIYGIASDHYLDDVTAVAYVYNGTSYTFDKAVTRNITEVTFDAIRNGETGSILTAVASEAKSNYMVVSGSLNVFNEYTITQLQTIKYGYSNLSDLYAEFLSDYNAATGASLTASTSASDFYSSLRTGLSDNTTRDLSASNAAKFFDGANFTKWSWILEYFAERGVNTHVKNQANALLRADRTCQTADGWKLVHLATSIYNLFKQAKETNGYSGNDFTGGESAYANVNWPAVTNFNDANVVKVGDSITLPSAPMKFCYDFSSYNDGTNNYSASSSYEVASTITTLKSVFIPTEYNINYHLDGGTNNVGNPSTYTVETNDINLLPATKDGYIFSGWFNNEGLTGSAVTSIPKGSLGDLNLYAKWTVPAPEALNVSNAEVDILNTITPDIIVKGDLTGKYYLSGTGLDDDYATNYYTLNSEAFTTLTAAMAAAKANDIIYVFAGTYSGGVTVDKSGIQIIGPNYNVNGYATRETEAIITGRLDITAANVTVNGLKFDGDGLIYKSAAHTTIEYIYTTATAVGACVGYSNRLGQLCGNGCQYLKVKNSWFNTPTSTEYQGAIVVAGRTDNTEISYNRISNTTRINCEVIMMYNVVGTLNIKNNTFDALTNGYTIRLYNCYYSSDYYATQINITNNTITGASNSQTTSGLQLRNLGTKAAVTANIVGNDFEYVSGNTFNLEGSTASATTNIKYNYFQYAFQFSTKGSSVINYVDNFYASAQTTATPDVSSIADKAALVYAYKASADFATYGSVCVYED